MIRNKPDYLIPKETERLITRPVILDDAKWWQEWTMDSIATKHFPDFIKGSPEKAELWIERILERYKQNKFGFHVITEKASNKPIGMCGLLTQEINGKEILEVGYSFLRKYWGNGFATEAATLFKEYGFTNYPVKEIYSIISPANISSANVAVRNGMTKKGSTVFYGFDVELYSITR